MSLQDTLPDDRRPPYPSGLQHVYPNVSSQDPMIAHGSNVAVMTVSASLVCMANTAITEFQVVCAGVAVSDDGACLNYNQQMVDHILRLDALAPEAKFDNVVDMMDWLNAD